MEKEIVLRILTVSVMLWACLKVAHPSGVDPDDELSPEEFLYDDDESIMGPAIVENGNITGRGIQFGIRPSLQVLGLPPKAATATITGVNNNIFGTFRMFQETMYSELLTIGTLIGLIPGETVNIHVRQRGDTSFQCSKQGNLFNPNYLPTGGFLLNTGSADDNGVLAVNNRVIGVDANLWGSVFYSIIRRSVRVSLGNVNGTILACGLIEPAIPGPNTVNNP